MADFFSVDIGRKNLKLIEVKRSGENAQLQSIGKIAYPDSLGSKLPSDESPEKLQLVASIIKSLVDSSDTKSKQVVSALPESSIFTKFMTLPLVDAAKLEEMIHWESKQLPIPVEESQLDWVEIERREIAPGKQVIDLMVIAAPRKLVETYLQLFEMAGLELIALEVESVALSRIINFTFPNNVSNTMVMDFGATGITISVLKNRKLIFTQSLGTGSDSFTRAIVNDFAIGESQADQYKINYGMAHTNGDGAKIYNSIKPVMDVVTNEVQKIVGFIENRMNYGRPQALLITGSGSMMPGLDNYLKTSLDINIGVIDPFVNLELKGNLENIKTQIIPTEFSIAVGLALKNE